ncbi:hypothetical protein ACJX0J_029184, partial [Zea mays]
MWVTAASMHMEGNAAKWFQINHTCMQLYHRELTYIHILILSALKCLLLCLNFGLTILF